MRDSVMNNLTTEQLEAIRRLLVDPLRETVKSEIQLSHDRLGSAVEKLADRLADHIQRTEKRVAATERDVLRLRFFRHRLVAIYGAVVVIVSLAWSVIRDRVLAKIAGR